jgi:hypothetical protein
MANRERVRALKKLAHRNQLGIPFKALTPALSRITGRGGNTAAEPRMSAEACGSAVDMCIIHLIAKSLW